MYCTSGFSAGVEPDVSNNCAAIPKKERKYSCLIPLDKNVKKTRKERKRILLCK